MLSFIVIKSEFKLLAFVKSIDFSPIVLLEELFNN